MGQHKLPKPPRPHFDVRAPKQKFSINFQTTTTGILQSVDVTLEVGTMDDEDIANIALLEHPLYPELYRYCKNNPPRNK